MLQISEAQVTELGRDMRAGYLQRLEQELKTRFPGTAAIQADARGFTERGVADAEALGLHRRGAIRRYLFLSAAVGAHLSEQGWAAAVIARDDLSPAAKLDVIDARMLFDPRVRA